MHHISRSGKKPRTILHFGTDRVVLLWRARSLNEMGYHVLNANNGFEAIQLATRGQVDAVVLDLDRNHAEVALVAEEIKRSRPQLPTLLLTEGATPRNRAHEMADALIPKRDDLEMLVTALETLLHSGPPVDGQEVSRSTR
jgi:CheY-like chemotaxis protein